MNLDPETLKLILAGAAVLLGAFAPKIWEKIKPFWPKAKNALGWSEEEETIDVDALELYSLHEIVEFLIADRKAAKDEEGVLLVGTLGKHLYDLRLEQKK